MKRFPLLAFVGAIVTICCAPGHAQVGTPQLLSKAQTEYLKGDVDAAKRDFEAVLQADPKNPTAFAFLRQIAAKGGTGNASETQQRQLAQLIIPKIDFKDATLASVLDYMKKAATKLSNSQTTANFVPQLSDEQMQSKTITLSLTNVPFTEVLKYIGTLADLQFVFDRYAILVKPTGGSEAPAAKPKN